MHVWLESCSAEASLQLEFRLGLLQLMFWAANAGLILLCIGWTPGCVPCAVSMYVRLGTQGVHLPKSHTFVPQRPKSA